MAKDENVSNMQPAQGPVTAASIREKALGALNKSAREALDAKVKGHMQKRVEAEKTVKQIDALIDADIDAFLAGL